MEEQFNRRDQGRMEICSGAQQELQRKWQADENRKHTSGGVVLLQSTVTLGAVVGAEEAAMESIPGNEGRIAQARVNCKRRFACLRGLLSGIPTGWSSRNEALLEAVMKRTRDHKASMADNM